MVGTKEKRFVKISEHEVPEPAVTEEKKQVEQAHESVLLGSPTPKRLQHDEYLFGWICPLEVEQEAAMMMLDEEHEPPTKRAGDDNYYVVGSINGHNVVIAGQSSKGNAAAAVVATDMRATFPNIKYILLVGIGGGVPTAKVERGLGRVCLGDIVVAVPSDHHLDVIQYDHGKALAGGKFERVGVLEGPPKVLRNAVQAFFLRRREMRRKKEEDPITANLNRIDKSFPEDLERFGFPGSHRDILFPPDYLHSSREHDCDEVCDIGKAIAFSLTGSSSANQLRPAWSQANPEDHYVRVHRGAIASGEKLLRDAELRDKLSKPNNILCFEMEAVGVINSLPCLVIRGISDYCDSHKNDIWHGYAAATAAAFARQIFSYVLAEDMRAVVTEELKRDVLEIKESLKDSKLSDLYKWLDKPHPLEPRRRHCVLQAERVLGTGADFLKKPELKMWLERDGSNGNGILFCHGEPGAGKSFICSLIIDELRNPKYKTHVAFIYCDYRERSKQTITAILGSLIAQIVSACSTRGRQLAEDWFSKHRRDGIKLENLKFTDILEVLVQLLSFIPGRRMAICFDAVDECEGVTFTGLLQVAKRLAKIPHVTLFVTGRSTVLGSMKKVQSMLSLGIVQLTAQVRDIQLYLDFRIDKDVMEKGTDSNTMDDNLRSCILEKLISNANGIFLLPALQIASILEGYNKHRRFKLLEETSSSVKGTFERMMQRIESQDPEMKALAMQTLSWLTFSRQTLNLADLQNALAIESGDTSLNSQNITHVRFIIQSCLGLVGSDPDTTSVGLFHYSIQEFLEQNQQRYFPGGELKIGEQCLTFINFSPFSDEVNRYTRGDDLSRQLLLETPFLKYAAGFWGYHIKDQMNEKVKALLINGPLFSSVSRSDEQYAHAFQAFAEADNRLQSRVDYYTGDDYEDDFGIQFPYNVAHLAAFFGSTSCLDILLQNPERPVSLLDSKDGVGRTPLALASREGHLLVIKYLIKHAKVEVNVKDDLGITPLSHAASNGHSAVVEFLLFNGADVTIVSLRELSALSYASERNQLPVAELLLKANGIENVLNLRSMSGRTPLSYAIQGGNRDLVTLLLSDERVDPLSGISKDSPFGKTSVSDAAEKGDESIFRILLQSEKASRGLVIKEDDGATPLKLAARHGHTAIVRLIVERIDVIEDNRTANYFAWTALEYAAMDGHVDMVELLLETQAAGAAPDQLKSINSSLRLAAQYGRNDVVRLLLNSGMVDVNSQNHSGQTALMLAALEGHGDVISLLIEATEINLQLTNEDDPDENVAGMGWTALFYAAAHGRENIVSLLIQHSESEGSLASKDRSGKTALIVASAHGHYDVVQTLLRRRGNQSFATSLYINETDNSGRTALSYASERGYESIVDLLLAQSANPSIQDDGGRNPLSYATEQGSNMVVKSLLSAMAPYIESEVDGRDKDGASPFSYAVRGYKVPGEGSISSGARKNDQIWSTYHQLQSRLSVIDLLLSTGFVDINSKDNTGRTPFSHAAGATFENGDIVKTLIQISGTRDMDLDMADDDGRTPLSYAAQAQADKDYFRLKHAFEMPTPDDYTSASRIETGSVVKLLLDTGSRINVNSVDKLGRTPLSYALKKRKQTWNLGKTPDMVINMLRDAGAVDDVPKFIDPTKVVPVEQAAYKGPFNPIKLATVWPKAPGFKAVHSPALTEQYARTNHPHYPYT